jgi:predicted Fe-Mo cluster-binding NifX family protein
MTARVAVASTDGKVINQHFGHADRFHIFDIDDSGFRYVESRSAVPFCAGGSHESRTDGEVLDLLTALRDCRAVLVSRIGGGAVDMLDANGIDSIEAKGEIEDVLRKISEEKIFE